MHNVPETRLYDTPLLRQLIDIRFKLPPALYKVADLILRDPLTYGLSKSYENADEAKGDELAEALFAVPHVTNVFYVDTWITVTQDGKAHWPDLLRQLAAPIRDAPSAQERSAELIDEGIARIEAALRDSQTVPGEELCSRLLGTVKRRADDIALLLIRFS